MPARFADLSRYIRLTLMVLVDGACSPELSDSPLAERSGAVDTSALPSHFRSTGGPVLLRVTGWANPESVRQLESAGLGPLPEHTRVERLDSLGMNIVGGTVPPGGLDSILAVRFVVAIEPVP